MKKLVFKDFQLEHNLDEIGIDNYFNANIDLYKSNGAWTAKIENRHINRSMAELFLKGDESSVRQSLYLYIQSVRFWMNEVIDTIK